MTRGRASSLASLAFACASSSACVARPPNVDELVPIDDARWAVVLSDYASTAIAVVASDGVVRAPWIDSGTTPPNLVATLSGDVVLPTHVVDPAALVVIDRYQTDVLSRIAFASPREGFLQADLRGGRTSGASPNPQDALAWGAAWLVSRFNPATSAVPELALGNDVVELDATTGELVGRFELGADAVGEDGVTYFARPSLLAPIDDAEGRSLVVVGLARLSSFTIRATGPGAIAVLDPSSGVAHVTELPGLSNCGAIASPTRAPDVVFALCQGDAFGTNPMRSGIVRLRVREGALEVDAQRTVASESALPPPGNGLVALDATHVAYVSRGAFTPTTAPDRLVLLDLEGDASVVLASEPTPFELGDGAFDAATNTLLVPDGNTAGVHVFDVRFGDELALTERAPIDLAHVGLAPRQVALVGTRD